MDETYRMLGREHEADLQREADKWRRAAEVRGQPAPAGQERTRRRHFRRVTSFLARASRAVT